jgi:hypothetical protein
MFLFVYTKISSITANDWMSAVVELAENFRWGRLAQT